MSIYALKKPVLAETEQVEGGTCPNGGVICGESRITAGNGAGSLERSINMMLHLGQPRQALDMIRMIRAEGSEFEGAQRYCYSSLSPIANFPWPCFGGKRDLNQLASALHRKESPSSFAG